MKRLTYRVNIGVPEDAILVDYKSTEECLEWKNVLKRLAYYEDLEEQGLLLKLPCKVGDVVWVIKNKEIYLHEIVSIENTKSGVYFISRRPFCTLDDFGKTVFLTHDEAEEALKGTEAGE